MIAEVKKYPYHYLALIIILITGIIGILLFRFDPVLKSIPVYLLGLLYVAWGIFHHHLAGHLRSKVVLEYALVAILGIVIINTLS